MRTLVLIAILPLAACQSNWEKQGQAAQPSGPGATRDYAVNGFTGVEVRGPDDVDVRTGPNFSVRAEGDPKVLDQLEIQVVGGTLRVGRKEAKHGNWNFGDHGARVLVTMPRLSAASIGGSGNLSVDRAEGDFHGAISGSGDLHIGALKGQATDLSVAGSGNLVVAGSASALTASVAGSGDIDAAHLTVPTANISIAGSGNVRGAVSGPASVSIVGSGDVELTGGAKCTVNAVGSGEARCS